MEEVDMRRRVLAVNAFRCFSLSLRDCAMAGWSAQMASLSHGRTRRCRRRRKTARTRGNPTRRRSKNIRQTGWHTLCLFCFFFSIAVRQRLYNIQHKHSLSPRSTHFTHVVSHPCAALVGLHLSTFHSANLSFSTCASPHSARLSDLLSISPLSL